MGARPLTSSAASAASAVPAGAVGVEDACGGGAVVVTAAVGAWGALGDGAGWIAAAGAAEVLGLTEAGGCVAAGAHPETSARTAVPSSTFLVQRRQEAAGVGSTVAKSLPCRLGVAPRFMPAASHLVVPGLEMTVPDAAESMSPGQGSAATALAPSR